ncbi:MAG: PqqD family protein [Anaerostipes sp.]|jgi:hypothetical protein|nr:PqqD family protein [Anaerostipes sp.]MDD3745937.1 PqqD family protein [Anaerostipes sp.]
MKLYKTNEDFLLREIAGEYILVPVGNGAQQLNGMLTLNDTFRFVWEQFKEARTIEDVVKRTEQEYDAEKGRIEQDVCQFVRECLEYGFMKEEELL